jgi:hypothetical protein
LFPYKCKGEDCHKPPFPIPHPKPTPVNHDPDCDGPDCPPNPLCVGPDCHYVVCKGEECPDIHNPPHDIDPHCKTN